MKKNHNACGNAYELCIAVIIAIICAVVVFGITTMLSFPVLISGICAIVAFVFMLRTGFLTYQRRHEWDL